MYLMAPAAAALSGERTDWGGPPVTGIAAFAGNFVYPVDRQDTSGRMWNISGSVRREKGAGPFGGNSALFSSEAKRSGLVYEDDNITSYLLGTNDFTIECWVRASAVPAGTVQFLAHWSTNAFYRSWTLNYSAGDVRMQFRDGSGSATRTASATIATPADFWDGAWHHIVAERVGATVTVYVDGVAGGSPYNIAAYGMRDPNSYFPPAIGCFNEYQVYENFDGGSIAECRMTVGSYRYGAAFTPPTAAFPKGLDDADWANVVMLTDFSGLWGYDIVKPAGLDAEGMDYTYGGTQFRGHLSKMGLIAQNLASGGITGDIAFTPTGTDFQMGSGDFTVEFYARRGASSGLLLGFMTDLDRSFWVDISSSKPVLKLSNDGTATTYSLSSSTQPANGVDFHMAFC